MKTYTALHLTKKFMQKLQLLFCLLVLHLSAFAQQSSSSNEVVIEGAAKMKVRPDKAMFTFTVEKIDTSEKRAITKLNETINVLEKSLNKIGIPNETIKISDYDVSGISYDRSVKKTFTATNTLHLEFLINKQTIDAVYDQFHKNGIQDVDIDFESKLSDSLEKVSRLQLIQLAIEDAKINAENIAKAMDIKLGRVKQVQKSAYEPVIFNANKLEYKAPVIEDIKSGNIGSFGKFEIEEIELTERIVVIYNIEP